MNLASHAGLVIVRIEVGVVGLEGFEGFRCVGNKRVSSFAPLAIKRC